MSPLWSVSLSGTFLKILDFAHFQHKTSPRQSRFGPGERPTLPPHLTKFPSSGQPPHTHLITNMPAQPPKKTPVALIGLGGVGLAIMRQLLSPPLASKFRLVMVANSKQYLYHAQPSAADFDVSKVTDELKRGGEPVDLPAMVGALSTHPEGPAILIDSTASDAIPALYPTILQMNIHVVTPNKKGFSGDLALAKNIIDASYPTPGRGSLVYGESTVGAGLPILSTLRDLLETGDEIKKIEGVFSGTLSYIFNEFSKVEGGDVAFSEVVKIAKEKGYTVGHRPAAHYLTLADTFTGTRSSRRSFGHRRRPKTHHPHPPLLHPDAVLALLPPPQRLRLGPHFVARPGRLGFVWIQGRVPRAARRGR